MLETAVMGVAGSQTTPVAAMDVEVDPDTVHQIKLYITADRAELDGDSTGITFHVKDIAGEEEASYSGVFRGPQ